MREWTATVLPDSDPRAAEMVTARCTGQTLATIGVRYGLTRERVRQITVKAAPWQPWAAFATERAAEAATAAHLNAQTAAERHPCRFCGTPNPRALETCTPLCTDRLRAVTYHLADGTRRRTQRRAIARWQATHGITTAYAERVLQAGGGSLAPDRRWVVPGSAAWEAITAALAGQLPIVAELDPVAVRSVTSRIDLSDAA